MVLSSSRVDKIAPINYIYTDEFYNENYIYKIFYMYFTCLGKRLALEGSFVL